MFLAWSCSWLYSIHVFLIFSQKREGFNTGCTIRFQLPVEDPPVNPTSVLSLVGKLKPRPQGPGKFFLGPYPIPRSTHHEPYLPLTTFIIRVEYNLQYYYYIQVCVANYFNFCNSFIFSFFQERISSSEIDLSNFGCKTVNISFAVANKDKVSKFSTVSSLCIHGGKRHEINTVVFTHNISLLLLLLLLLLMMMLLLSLALKQLDIQS